MFLCSHSCPGAPTAHFMQVMVGLQGVLFPKQPRRVQDRSTVTRFSPMTLTPMLMLEEMHLVLFEV